MADRRAWIWITVVGLALASSGCSDDRVADTGEGPVVEGMSASSTTAASSTSTEPPPTSSPPRTSTPSTSMASTSAEPSEPGATDGLIVADVAPSSPFGGQRMVGYGDEFVRFEQGAEELAVSVSADGQVWEPRPSDPVLVGRVMAASSDSRRIVLLLTSITGDEGLPAPWVSDDGGRTFSELPLPDVLPDEGEYVDVGFEVGGVAVDGQRIVVTGAVTRRIDWPRYAVDVLRQDHGFVTGEGGFPEAWTVEFEDGFELTVNLLELGLPDTSPSAAITVLAHDGTGWTESPGFTLDGPEMNAPEVVAGPAGFGARAGTRVVTSRDGIRWDRHPVPVDAAQYGARLLGGPAGYVLITPTSLFHSTGGETWTESYVVTESDPWETGFGFMGSWSSAAGAAGFVVGLPVFGDQGIESVSVAWSADGLDWLEQPLPDGAIDITAAVADSIALVLPFEEAEVVLPELPADDEGLEQAIVSTLYHPDGQQEQGGFVARFWMTQEEAICTAETLFASLGTDRLREIRFGLFPFHVLGYGLSGLIELDDAHAIAAAARACSPDWELLLITTATSGTDRISEPSARCTADALDDDVSEEMMTIELARPYDDVPNADGPDLSHLQPLWDALDECLTDQELNALDWS